MSPKRARYKNVRVHQSEKVWLKSSYITTDIYGFQQNDSLLKQKSIPSFCCWTATMILALFVPFEFVAMHSYKPLSAGIIFLMASVPWFTSVLPAGKGIPTLLQFITGRGKPSVWQTTWKVVLCIGVASGGGTFVKIGRPDRRYVEPPK